MNDLLPNKAFIKGRGEYVDLKKDAARDLEMGLSGEQQSLAVFFEEVSFVKKEMDKVKELLDRLKSEHEESKCAQQAQAMKAVRDRMDLDVHEVLQKARVIKSKLEQLDASNEASRRMPGCGLGTSSDRTRSSITNSLRKKLKDMMEEFQGLREMIRGEYKETVVRRFYTVNGEMPNEETVEHMIGTGESEVFLQRAIQEQGRGHVLDTIAEIQERHDAVCEIEKNLLELHQIFMDMAVMVDVQGEQLNDIAHYMNQANTYIDKGARELKGANQYQRSSRKWTFIALIILILFILIVIIPVITSFKRS